MEQGSTTTTFHRSLGTGPWLLVLPIEVTSYKRPWPARHRAGTGTIIGWLVYCFFGCFPLELWVIFFPTINSNYSTGSQERRKIGMKAQVAFLCLSK